MTAPATRTRRPGRAARQIARALHAARRERRAHERHRMRTNREPRAVVVGAGRARRATSAASGDVDGSALASSSGPRGAPARSACHSSTSSGPAGRPPAPPATAPSGDRRRTTPARRLSASVRTSSCRSAGTRHQIVERRRSRRSLVRVAAARSPFASAIRLARLLLCSPLHVASVPAGRAPSSCIDAAVPVRHLHVDRREADAAPLRVLDERRRMVEPHRLVVEQRRVERRRESAP